MPSRVIRGEINSSESLSRVSIEAELTFRALISAVDDYGRVDARPGVLKGLLFPLRDAFTPGKIAECVRELDAEGCVQLYQGEDGRPYLWLTGWEKHRGTSKRGVKSRCPEPPARSLDPRGFPGDPSESRESRVESRESRVESARGKPGKPAAPAAAKPNGRPKGQKTPAPDDLDGEQKQALLDWVRRPPKAHGLGREDLARPERLRALVDACLDHHRSRGHLLADWLATCRMWVRNEADGKFAPTRAAPPERIVAKAPDTFVPPREPGIDYDEERRKIAAMIRDTRKALHQ